MKKEIIKFRSTMSNYLKEESGTKPNTVRSVDKRDNRFKLLKTWSEKYKCFDLWVQIQLCNCTDGTDIWQSFERQVKDVTFFDDYVIISWRD